MDATAAIRGARRERKPFGNPNAGKRGGARLAQRENPSQVRASEVSTRYMPGKTIDARIAGIQSYYSRELAVAQIGA
jgi:hypothetical protein